MWYILTCLKYFHVIYGCNSIYVSPSKNKILKVLPILSLQYWIWYCSVNSCPCPPPNLPWVSAPVIQYSVCRFTSSHSSTPTWITERGHQAPPRISWRTLSRFYIFKAYNINELSFSTNSNFQTPISLQPDDVNLWNLIILFIKILVSNIYNIGKISDYQSLWQIVNSFID